MKELERGRGEKRRLKDRVMLLFWPCIESYRTCGYSLTEIGFIGLPCTTGFLWIPHINRIARLYNSKLMRFYTLCFCVILYAKAERIGWYLGPTVTFFSLLVLPFMRSFFFLSFSFYTFFSFRFVRHKLLRMRLNIKYYLLLTARRKASFASCCICLLYTSPSPRD